MSVFLNRIKKNSVVLLPLLAAVVAACLLGQGAAAPLPRVPKARLDNPVDIAVAGVEIDAAVILPDNETLVVVGGTPWQQEDKDWVHEDAPPASAIINLKTKAIRPFTNGHSRVRIKSVACATDGLRIFTSCAEKDPFVRIWNVKAGKSLEPLAMPKIEKNFGEYTVARFTTSRKIAVAQWESVGILDPTGIE